MSDLVLSSCGMAPSIDRPPFGQFGPPSRHPRFSQRLAELRRPRSVQGFIIEAGELVLDLVDQRSVHTLIPEHFAHAKLVVDRLLDDPTGVVLRDLIHALQSDASCASVSQSLLAYGEALEGMGEWILAIDVYETALRSVRRPMAPADLALFFLRVGLCHRRLNDTRAAFEVYGRGYVYLRRQGDRVAAFRLRAARADLTLQHGPLCTAIHRLDGLLRRAVLTGDEDLIAQARHYRGRGAIVEGDPLMGALLCAKAFQRYNVTRSTVLLEQVRDDLGQALRGCGERDAARDAFIVNAIRASQLEMRASAICHLLQFAIEDNNRPDFVRYSRDIWRLTEWPLPLQIECYRLLLEGYEIFGDRVRARRARATLAHLESNQAVARDSEVAVILPPRAFVASEDEAGRLLAILTDLQTERNAAQAVAKPPTRIATHRRKH